MDYNPAIVGQLPNESSAVIIFERRDRDRNYVVREGADALLALDQQSRPEILSIAVEEIEQEEAVLRDQRAASRYAGRRRHALRALSAASPTAAVPGNRERNRKFDDSLLEQAVRSEPVSETGFAK